VPPFRHAEDRFDDAVGVVHETDQCPGHVGSEPAVGLRRNRSRVDPFDGIWLFADLWIQQPGGCGHLVAFIALVPGDVERNPGSGEGCRAELVERILLRVALQAQQDAGQVELAATCVQLEQSLVFLHAARRRCQVFERPSEHVHSAGHREALGTLVEHDASDLIPVVAQRLQFTEWRHGGFRRRCRGRRGGDRRRTCRGRRWSRCLRQGGRAAQQGSCGRRG